MSKEGIINVNEENHAYMDITKKRVFLYDNDYVTETLKNETGSEKTYEKGTVVAKDPADGKIVQHDATAQDGTEFPVGVLAETVTIPDTNEEGVQVCIGGEVAENHLVLTGSQTLDGTAIGDVDGTKSTYYRTIRDAIRGETKGIRLRKVDDLSGHDNS